MKCGIHVKKAGCGVPHFLTIMGLWILGCFLLSLEMLQVERPCCVVRNDALIRPGFGFCLSDWWVASASPFASSTSRMGTFLGRFNVSGSFDSSTCLGAIQMTQSSQTAKFSLPTLACNVCCNVCNVCCDLFDYTYEETTK